LSHSVNATAASQANLSVPNSAVQRERILLILAGAFLIVNYTALSLQRPDVSFWLHFGVWLTCVVTGHLLLNRYLPQRDPILFALVMLLSGWGLLLIERLTPLFADRQALWLIIATTALIAAAAFPHMLRWLRRYRYLLLILGLGLLIATIILGRNPSGFGPELWLGFGQIFFQPSEALKLILVAFLASYLGEEFPVMNSFSQPGRLRLWLPVRIFGPILLMWGLCVVLLVWQRDLGTAALFFLVFSLLLYVASGRILIFISGMALMLIAGYVAYLLFDVVQSRVDIWLNPWPEVALMLIAGYVAYLLFDVVQSRVDIWLNPWPEASNRAFQIVQSLMAFSAGGIFGEGIGQGVPTYVPVVHSDFVIAALAEEWGLLGVLTVIAAVALLIVRGTRSGLIHSERPFHVLLASGLSLMLGVQSLLIMAGTLKLLPLTGVTLPFLSYGGSSLVVSFIMVGLLIRLSGDKG